jgi:hypothetical protein
MRPVLTLLGFLIGLILLVFALTLLNGLFVPLTQSLYVASGDVFTGARVGLALFYAIMALAVTNLAFKGITWLPDRVLQWLGQAELMPAMTVVTAPAGQAAHAAVLPSAAHEAVAAAGISSSVAAGASGGYPAGGKPSDATMAAARAHGLKAALLPAYREPPLGPVIIGTKEEGAAAVAKGGDAHSSSAATASTSGDKASATASASATARATAIAMERQIPLPDKPTPADIEKALERLALTVDKRTASAKKDGNDDKGKKIGGKEDSREQTSAPPEDDKPA